MKVLTLFVLLCVMGGVEGKVIYEKAALGPFEKFDYSSMHAVTYSYSGPCAWNVDLTPIVTEMSQGKIKVVTTGKESIDMHAMTSPVMVYLNVDQIKDKLVSLTVTVSVKGNTENNFHADMPLRDNYYLIEQDGETLEEIQKIVKSNLKSFVDEYMASQKGALKEDTFYVWASM